VSLARRHRSLSGLNSKGEEMRYGIGVMAAVALCGIVVLAAGPAEKGAGKLVFAKNGFAIAPLDEPGKGTCQVLMMFLPASDGFAPNVNVQTQEFGGTLEEYGALSKKQFEEMKLKTLNDKIEKGVLTLEYAGEMQKRKLHWYAVATLKGGKVYLITATAAEGQWADVSGKLKACVDSFETIEGKAQK